MIQQTVVPQAILDDMARVLAANPAAGKFVLNIKHGRVLNGHYEPERQPLGLHHPRDCDTK